MKSGHKSSINKGPRPSKDVKFCSYIVLVSWLLICGWVIFLWYCWKSGLLLSSRMPNLLSVVNKTEHSIIDKINKIRTTVHERPKVIPQEQILTPMSHSPQSGIHVIFSTDCSEFQDWQTIVVFHSATVVGQEGSITRIASGCSEEKKEMLTKLYKRLYPQYHVHFTPDFKSDKKTNRRYDFYNKPYGLEHWLDNTTPPIGDDVIIALIDPDFVFLRPLTAKVEGEPNVLYTSGKQSDIFKEVGRGVSMFSCTCYRS